MTSGKDSKQAADCEHGGRKPRCDTNKISKCSCMLDCHQAGRYTRAVCQPEFCDINYRWQR